MEANQTLIEEVAEDLRVALETGAVSRERPQDGLQLVIDLLRARYPDTPLPPTLCPFSALAGAAYILGAKLHSGDL